MTDEQNVSTGDVLFEAFVEQVKQVLEHLYDFAYLQQHTLARVYDSGSDLSTRSAGRQLRYELIKAIESLKPVSDTHFRAPDGRLYEVLHLCYVENLTVQEAATELGLSDRQAYRDLKRGQQTVAAVLWDNRLPSPRSPDVGDEEFSLESEVARLQLNFSPVDIGTLFEQARRGVERLAEQQSVEFAVEPPTAPMILSTDPALAHQIIVSTLSYVVQQARPGVLTASFILETGGIALALRFPARADSASTPITDSAVARLGQRLHWSMTDQLYPNGERSIVLRMISGSTTILVIDDNEGWVELLNRYLDGSDIMVVATRDGQEGLRKAQEINPSAIILDVMMPDKDGWELLQWLRALPATANVPIIVCTGFNDPQLAWSLGASAFISKPTNRERILEALRDVGVI